MIWLAWLGCGRAHGVLSLESDTPSPGGDTAVPEDACPTWEEGCPLLGEIPLSAAPTVVTGTHPFSRLGHAMVMGRGAHPWLAVAAAGPDDLASVVLMSPLQLGTFAAADADVVLTTAAFQPTSFRSLAAGNLDGRDGDDLLVGTFDSTNDHVSLIAGPPVSRSLDDAPQFASGGPNSIFGSAVAACDVDGDRVPESWISDTGIHRGAGALYALPVAPTGTVDVTGATTEITGEPGQNLGMDIACIPDADGDGRQEIAVSAGLGAVGSVAIVSASNLGSIPWSDVAVRSDGPYRWGASLEGAGEIPLVIGDPGASDTAFDAGLIALFTELDRGLDLSTATAVIRGDAYLANLGAASALGDVDGDGHTDLLVVAPGTGQTEGTPESRAYLFYGPIEGELRPADADATFTGVGFELFAGSAVIGDLDEDGFDDIALGAPSRSDGDGGVYLFRGSSRSRPR
jgi:hypothetical protein